MNVTDLRRRQTVPRDPLGAQRENHEDDIDVHDGLGMGHGTGAEQCLARRDVGISRSGATVRPSEQQPSRGLDTPTIRR